MPLNSFDIYLVNRIQEKGTFDLNESNEIFGKSPSTIRRAIQEINDYLDEDKKFIINDLVIINQLTYYDYLNFIQKLTLSHYVLSYNERCHYVIALSFLQGNVNLTQHYEELHVSISTKKKDRQLIDDYLLQHDLSLVSHPGKGISIQGSEAKFRILTCSLLLKVVEIDENNRLCARQANSPIEQKIFQFYNDTLFQDKNDILDLIEVFLKKYNYRIGYTSKKFLYLYYLLASYRISQNLFIEKINSMPVLVTAYTFFEQPLENQFINGILCSLDYNANNPIILDNLLAELTESLLENIEKKIVTTFYTKPILFKQTYNYLYKTILRNFYSFDFYDNKLDDTKNEYPFLYEMIAEESQLIAQNFFTLNNNQIATLTLMFRHHVLKNKVFGRNRKKVAIVTNSAKEKAIFFAELLKHYVDVEIVDTIHINELYLLKILKIEYVITFSNRISTILLEKGYPVIKLNYYLHSEDINTLLCLKFSSSSKRKLLAAEFCQDLLQQPQSNWLEYLKHAYPDFFI